MPTFKMCRGAFNGSGELRFVCSEKFSGLPGDLICQSVSKNASPEAKTTNENNYGSFEVRQHETIPSTELVFLGPCEASLTDLASGEAEDCRWSEDKCKRLDAMITRLFDHWKLSIEDRAEVLGLSGGDYSPVGLLPRKPETLTRMSYLLGMHACLRLLFPNIENRDLTYAWVSTFNRQFNMTPVAVMKERGLDGIVEVFNYLWEYSHR